MHLIDSECDYDGTRQQCGRLLISLCHAMRVIHSESFPPFYKLMMVVQSSSVKKKDAVTHPQ